MRAAYETIYGNTKLRSLVGLVALLISFKTCLDQTEVCCPKKAGLLSSHRDCLLIDKYKLYSLGFCDYSLASHPTFPSFLIISRWRPSELDELNLAQWRNVTILWPVGAERCIFFPLRTARYIVDVLLSFRLAKAYLQPYHARLRGI